MVLKCSAFFGIVNLEVLSVLGSVQPVPGEPFGSVQHCDSAVMGLELQSPGHLCWVLVFMEIF